MRRMLLPLLGVAGLVVALIAWRGLRTQSAAPPASGGERPAGGLRLARVGGRVPGASGGIEGRVLDPGGAPAAGAQLVLAGGYRDDELPHERPGPVAVAQADAGGRFHFGELGPGRYLVTAASPRAGLAPAISEQIDLAAGQRRSIELRLGSGGVLLRGRVSDSGGGPLTGAVLSVVPMGEGPRGAGWNVASVSVSPAYPMLRVTTDQTGGYALNLSRGQQAVMVEAEGYVSQGDVLTLAADTTKDFRLDPGAGIAGRVLARAGEQPLADAEVTLSREGTTSTRPHKVKTDGTGAFRLTGLGPGSYVLGARLGKLVGHSEQLQLASAQRLESVTILCDASFSVSGRVTWRDGNVPPHAWVSAMSAAMVGDVPGVPVAADSQFRIDGLLPGSYRLKVDAMPGPRAEKQVRIEDRDLTGVVIDVGPNNVIRGVVQAVGRPVAGAAIVVSARAPQLGGRGYNSSVGGTADGDGRFEIPGVVGTDVAIHAHQPDIGSAQWGPGKLEAALAGPVTLQLRPGASLAGQVRTAEGRPAAGALVRCGLAGETGYRDMIAKADTDGRYVMKGLPAGDVGVEVRAADDDRGRARRSVSIRLAAGEQKRLDVQLPGRSRLRGRVLLPDGRPAAGARVVAGPSDQGSPASDAPRVTSDDSGGFTLDDLEGADRYHVWAGLPGYGDAYAARVPAGHENVVLRLSAESSAAGVVVDGAGKPVTDYQLGVQPTGAAAADAEAAFASSSLGFHGTTRIRDARGAFELRALPPGSYELRSWSRAEGHQGRLRMTLAAGERKRDLRLVLQGGISLRGRLVDADSGRPLGGVTVETLGRQAETGTDGAFAFEDVPRVDVANLSFGLEGRGYHVEPEPVPVPADAKAIDAGTIRFLKGDMAAKLEGGPPGLIGITHDVRDGHVVLTRIVPDFPGQRAGLLAGDHLLAVDGKPVAGLSMASRTYLMRGKPGTSVTLTVQSGALQRTVTITRQAAPPR